MKHFSGNRAKYSMTHIPEWNKFECIVNVVQAKVKMAPDHVLTA